MPANESVFARWLDPEKELVAPDPSIKLLEWLTYRWAKPTVTLRDICWRGPGFLQNDRESALNLLKVLTQRGNLIPVATHRAGSCGHDGRTPGTRQAVRGRPTNLLSSRHGGGRSKPDFGRGILSAQA